MEDLGLQPEEYEELQRDLARLAIYSLSHGDDSDDDGHGTARSSSLVDRRIPDPVDALQKREAIGVVLRGLDEKERSILALYYFESITMKEIGRRLGLSESRVCQIHGEVLKRLRDALAEKSEELVG